MPTDDLVYGLHTVQKLLALTPERVIEVWCDQRRQDQRLITIQKDLDMIDMLWHRVSRGDLDKMVGGVKHQGVVARCQKIKTKGEADLMAYIDTLSGNGFYLVLDGVQDPHNLGACLRSADAAGVSAVIVPRDKAASLTAVAIKVASGAAQSVPFFQVTNLARIFRELKNRSVWLVGADGGADQDLYQLDLTGSIALIMGGEGTGLRRLTKQHCDYLASLPMAGVVESLNVSVATGICLFEAVRQRQGRDDHE